MCVLHAPNPTRVVAVFFKVWFGVWKDPVDELGFYGVGEHSSDGVLRGCGGSSFGHRCHDLGLEARSGA